MLHKHFDINAVILVSREETCYVRRTGRMTCTRPAALNYTNPRAHWPKVSEAWGQATMSIWALKGATHSNRRNPVKSLNSDAIGPLRGPIHFLLAIPRPHQVFRPVCPGVKDSQGRWPCAGLQPAKLSPDTNGYQSRKPCPRKRRQGKFDQQKSINVSHHAIKYKKMSNLAARKRGRYAPRPCDRPHQYRWQTVGTTTATELT